MKRLQLEKVWSVFQAGRGCVGVDGVPVDATDADRLEVFAEVAERIALLHHTWGEPYPSPFAPALSLDASGCLSLALLAAWDVARDCIKEGADLLCDALAPYAYVELCHEGLDGRAIRLITRGTLPTPCTTTRAVLTQDRGFVCLTTERISGRPAWRGDPGGVIGDATEALDYLLGERKPQYVPLG